MKALFVTAYYFGYPQIFWRYALLQVCNHSLWERQSELEMNRFLDQCMAQSIAEILIFLAVLFFIKAVHHLFTDIIRSI